MIKIQKQIGSDIYEKNNKKKYIFRQGRMDCYLQTCEISEYVMSFRKGGVTPEEALYVGEEWARSVFGYSMQILMGTHTDTDHIHVHFAVNAYDMKGRHWIDNQKTLKEENEDRFVTETVLIYQSF